MLCCGRHAADPKHPHARPVMARTAHALQAEASQAAGPRAEPAATCDGWLTLQRVQVQHHRPTHAARRAVLVASSTRRTLHRSRSHATARQPARVAHHHQRPVRQAVHVHRHEQVVLGEQVHALPAVYRQQTGRGQVQGAWVRAGIGQSGGGFRVRGTRGTRAFARSDCWACVSPVWGAYGAWDGHCSDMSRCVPVCVGRCVRVLAWEQHGSMTR